MLRAELDLVLYLVARETIAIVIIDISMAKVRNGKRTPASGSVMG